MFEGNPCVNIATATTTVIVPSRPGALLRVIVNKPLADAVITIYDSGTGSGTKIGTITFPATLLSSGPVAVEYGAVFAVGLTVVTSAAVDLTVVYR